MEEAVPGTSAVAPESVINIDNIDIHEDYLVNDVDPIGAAFDPRTPNTVEVPTSIICNPNRSSRDKSIKDMKKKEDAFEARSKWIPARYPKYITGTDRRSIHNPDFLRNKPSSLTSEVPIFCSIFNSNRSSNFTSLLIHMASLH
jgi:hypothetical protein